MLSQWSERLRRRARRGPVATATRNAQFDAPWGDDEQNRELGARGEEIVYREELERLRGREHPDPEAAVRWTSRDDPWADYDIESVDDDGGPLWIEVKATSGTGGRFHWPKAEFERALHQRERYVLYRVYEAHTSNPTVKAFRDPIGMLLERKIRWDIAELDVEVEPMAAGA